jgi:hypothetical protein
MNLPTAQGTIPHPMLRLPEHHVNRINRLRYRSREIQERYSGFEQQVS